MRFLLLVLVSWLFSTIALSIPISSPDLQKTPGSFCTPSDPDFREYRYEEHIPWCIRSVDSSTKVKVYQMYGVKPSGEYTIDHLIPLFLGGSNHIDNLWPQHKSIYSGKLEYQIYIQLKKGEITQQEAMDMIFDFKLGFQ